MNIVILDWTSFAIWVVAGGLLVFFLIIGVLLANMAFFSFLIWRKGEKNFLWKTIIFALASVAVLIGGLTAGAPALGFGEWEMLYVGSLVFMILMCVAAGLGIYRFIYNTWIKKEEPK